MLYSNFLKYFGAHIDCSEYNLKIGGFEIPIVFSNDNSESSDNMYFVDDPSSAFQHLDNIKLGDNLTPWENED